jgi:F-type H+-transporting ATPase subunit b
MLPVLAAVGAKAAEQAKGGLPQLNAADFAPQLIWLAITFVALYFVLARLALPRVGEVLEGRKDRIRKDLEEAQRLKAETEKAIASYEQALGEARARAQKLAAENRDRLNAEIARERAEVESRISSKTADAEKRIAQAKARAMGQVNGIASDVTQSIVAQLIGQQVAPADVARALALKTEPAE